MERKGRLVLKEGTFGGADGSVVAARGPMILTADMFCHDICLLLHTLDDLNITGCYHINVRKYMLLKELIGTVMSLDGELVIVSISFVTISEHQSMLLPYPTPAFLEDQNFRG